jgi:hypothetical protein
MNLLDGRIGGIVATGTTGSGVGTWLNVIPNEIGKLATLVGIILSITLIIMYIRKMRQEARESDLKLELLRIQLAKEKNPV